MDNSPGGGTPTQPPSSPPAPTDSPGAPEVGPAAAEFTVPVPAYAPPTQALPTTPAPPPAVGPWSASAPGSVPYAAGTVARQAPSDAESLHNLALVLVGVVVGFWLMVGIRMLARLVDAGFSDRLLIETIDRTAAETLGAALVSVLAVASAVGGRLLSDRRVGGLLVWSASALAAATVGTAVWRLV